MVKLYKMVDGKRVELTEAEYDQREIDRLAQEQLLAEQERIRYKEQRIKGYGSIGDQLDMIYHKGLDAWKAHIATVKSKYPKPE